MNSFFLDTSIYAEFQKYIYFIQAKGGILINIEKGLIQEYYNREHQKSELHVQNDFRVKELVRITPRSFIYIIFLDNKLKLLLNSVSSGLFLIEIDNGQIPSSSINTRGNAKFIISIKIII